MTWQPIDYQGITELDKRVLDQIDQYLNQKESALAASLLLLLDIPISSFASLEEGKNRLSFPETIELIKKKLNGIKNPDEQSSIEQKFKRFELFFWDYVEVLEGSIVELFQQVEQIGLDSWQFELAWVLDSLKETFRQKIEGFKNFLRQLEKVVQEQHEKVTPQKFFSWKKGNFFWDTNLYSHLDNSLKFLLSEHQRFINKYHGYQALKSKTQEYLNKFERYHGFIRLEKGSKDKFRDIYEHIRMLEINSHAKSVAQEDLVKDLRSLITIESAQHLFKSYLKVMDEILFQTSRIIKLGLDENRTSETVCEDISECKTELNTLGFTIEKYRDFLLKANPNPYIRSRLGFSEWIVGPEPEQTKELKNQVFEVESLKELYIKMEQEFKQSLNREIDIEALKQHIQDVIHEMSQPLTSKSRMQKQAETLLHYLRDSHELGSTQLEVVEMTDEALSKAMRADWKYQTLQELPEFHKIYDLHRRILGLHGDRAHTNRMNHFKELFKSIEGWINEGTALAHTHEIETEMNDIKMYLQDFLAQLQRIEADKDISQQRANRMLIQMRFHLLMYRYSFGKFFSHLRHSNIEGRQLRKQFLFVDQYFEFIEGKINDIKMLHSSVKIVEEKPEEHFTDDSEIEE